MISSLCGSVTGLHDDQIVVELHGIGLAVKVPDGAAFNLGSSVTLYTVLRWHPEEGPALYGFATTAQRALFEQITSCSGFGPKIALAFCRTLSPRALCQAVAQEEYGVLTAVDGVGRKKAEALIFHLKDRLEQLMALDAGLPTDIRPVLYDVQDALKALGYAKHEIVAATSSIDATAHFDVLLRTALQKLAK